MNGPAAIAARRRPLPLCRMQRGVEPADIPAGAGDDRPFVAVVDFRVRFQKSNAIVELINGAVDGAPARTMVPVAVPIILRHRRCDAGGEKKGGTRKNDTPIGHGHAPLRLRDDNRSRVQKERQRWKISPHRRTVRTIYSCEYFSPYQPPIQESLTDERAILRGF